MTDTITDSADPTPETAAPLVEIDDVGKNYGNIIALQGINLQVGAGEVTCVLGDNGAGKSTLIKIIAGLHQHSSGTYEVDGHAGALRLAPRGPRPRHRHRLPGPRRGAADAGVAQLLPRQRGPQGPPRMDIALMRRTTKKELLEMGIDLRDVDQPIGTLSGGERQCVAIARAVYFGAKVLILDEPTAALGVKQSGVVLRYIIQARERGLGVIFITHNPHHAYPVGDRFLLLKRGRNIGYFRKNEVTRDELTALMAGGAELEELSHELEQGGGAAAEAAKVIGEEAKELGITEDRPTR